MIPAVIALAAQVGAPLVKGILEQRMGARDAKLANDVLDALAQRVGVPVDQLAAAAASDPEKVKTAVVEVEKMTPELIGLYAQGLDKQFELLASEADDPVWMRAWRPLGMYGLGVLWFWNVIFLHVANAYWKIALPPMDFGTLMQLSGLYMGLYMGGHTIKDVAAKFTGAA